MRVCIVTVYNSENCGSVLQAYALGAKLRELGCEVKYLKRGKKGTGASAVSVMKVIAKSLITFNFGNISLKLKFHHQCRIDEKIFDTIGVQEMDGIDFVILGSDTIWQLENDYFCRNMTKYWGLNFSCDNILSYAPSVDGTLVESFLDDERVRNALESMQAISVRDEYSRQVLSNVTSKPIELVCDPTLLHKCEFYRGIQRECNINDFILLYAFRNFCSKAQIDEIISFARKTGKKLVSFGVYRKWCDICVPFDSFAMPAYFEKADYVITNTFHGTVFSILYLKRFADFALNSCKVKELLTQFELEGHMVDASKNVQDVLEKQVNSKLLEKRIDSIRNSSIEYLKKNLCID